MLLLYCSSCNDIYLCLSVQAESALDQMDWIEKITGVIASLLSSQAPERVIIQKFSHIQICGH